MSLIHVRCEWSRYNSSMRSAIVKMTIPGAESTHRRKEDRKTDQLSQEDE